MSVKLTFSEAYRIAILTVLNKDTDHRVNERMLRTSLEALYAFDLSKVEMRRELSFLEAQLCLKLEILHEDMWAATLTERGQRAAHGKERVPGVDEPELD